MRGRAAIVVLFIAAVLFGCNGDEKSSPAQTAATPDQHTPPMDALTAPPLTTELPSGSSSAASLKAGYFVCESGGQLRWFIDLQDLNSLWEPHPPGWRIPVQLDGGTHFRYQASKALDSGWCRSSSSMQEHAVEMLEDCDNNLPYPNGGCRKIRTRAAGSTSWTEWYTFGDALPS